MDLNVSLVQFLEAGELMSVLASRLPALVNDPKFVKLLDSGIQCCDSMSINAVSTRFLGSVVPILRHTTVSSAALHKLLYDVLACGAFKHIPSLLDVTIRLKESGMLTPYGFSNLISLMWP